MESGKPPYHQITPMLTNLENKVSQMKKRLGGNPANGKATPITKSMNFSVSMVNQISKTMDDMIKRFEEKLQNSRQELDNFGAKLEDHQKMITDFSLEGDSLAEIPGLDGKTLNKNRFSASRGELQAPAGGQSAPKRQEVVDTEVEKLFLKAETKHGIARTSLELRKVATKIMRGDPLLFIKVNLMSNSHILYDVLSLAGKKVAILFLHPPLAKVYRRVVPQEIEFLTIQKLPKLTSTLDVLFIENCELFEDLSYSELRGVKHCLSKIQGTKVLVSNLITYRAFCVMKEQISVPFSGIALPGLKIENLGITASNDKNKSYAMRKFLSTICRLLQPNDKILILTNSQSEANELYKFISSQCIDAMYHIRLKDIHFGPITNPPLNSVFSLVVYFSLPNKLEKFFGHVSMLYNNFYYRNYGKLSQLPKIHFHVFVNEDDFAALRYKTFLKGFSQLQVNRLLKSLDDQYNSKRDQVEGALTAKISLTKLGKICDLSTSAMVLALRECQTEKLIAVNQPYPVSFNVRVINSQKANKMLKRVLDVSKRSSGVYNVRLAEVAEVLDTTLVKAGQLLKKFQLEGSILLEVEEELIDVRFDSPVAPRMQEVAERVYNRTKACHKLENDLLKYMYLTFNLGAANSNNFFDAQCKKRLSLILNKYALADQSQITMLFKEQIIKTVMSPLRGSADQRAEIKQVYTYLLSENRDTFLSKEVNMCRANSAALKVVSEYLIHAIVRTMCGQPPKTISLFDLKIKTSTIEFQKFDPDTLLTIAQKALIDFLKSS